VKYGPLISREGAKEMKEEREGSSAAMEMHMDDWKLPWG
jgi:hypothetical protein